MTRIPLWDELGKTIVIFLTMYEVIYDSITENLVKLFARPSKENFILSLLTEKISSISKSDTKQQITKDHNLPLINLGKELELGYTHMQIHHALESMLGS